MHPLPLTVDPLPLIDTACGGGRPSVRTRSVAAAALIFCAISAWAPLAPATAPGAEPTAEYRIGIEDVLVIAMPDHPEWGVEVTVQPGGKITLLMIDDVFVVGLTPTELKLRLVEAYRRYIPAPNISVRSSDVLGRCMPVAIMMRISSREMPALSITSSTSDKNSL